MGGGGDHHKDDGHHGHGGGGHDDHHGHGEERLPIRGAAAPFEKIPLPAIGTPAYELAPPTFDNAKPMPKPRTFTDMLSNALALNFSDNEKPTPGLAPRPRTSGVWNWLTTPWVPVRPHGYVDTYTRPNPCPEEHWDLLFRWPRTTDRNPKVAPPKDGAFTDYYHMLAFRHWFEQERKVYNAHVSLVQEMLFRCILKEGEYNAAKNCRHIYNKVFAMTRQEEQNMALLYMAVTGNAAIRETPYPSEFLDEKRKVYDDWLFRTRMRKPGDVA